MCDECQDKVFAQARPGGQVASFINRMVLASLMASLTAASSLLAIPLGPVPITLQSLFVLAAGGILGARWGAVSMSLYLLMGMAGLPVFAGGTSGIGKILGPSGGYLLGFVISAALVGFLTHRFQGKIYLFLACLAGLALIYSLGSVWLSLVSRISMENAIALGVMPFLPGDLVKASLAALLIARWRVRVKKYDPDSAA
ncbi:MAG: biotin transporter BioY [bacterium]